MEEIEKKFEDLLKATKNTELITAYCELKLHLISVMELANNALKED